MHYEITWLDKLGRNWAGTEDINNAGDVVGYVYDYVVLKRESYSTNHTAFVYVASEGGVIDLNVMINDMIADSSFEGWTATSAIGINDSGQIVGKAENDVTGETRGFMFDPIGQLCVLLPLPIHDGVQTAREDQQPRRHRRSRGRGMENPVQVVR